MVKALLKKPLFWCGFLFIFLWLAGSFLYLLIWHNHIPIADLMLDQNGQVTARPPYSPAMFPPLGADDFGQNIFIVILIGAKFTLGFAILIALLRVILSGFFGVTLRLYASKIGRVILAPFESLSFFPIALLAYFILQWVLFQDAIIHQGHFTYSFWERTWMDVAALTLISLPTTTQTLFNETDYLLQREFIDSAKILGGSRSHIFLVHLKPFLSPRLFLVFIREIIQVLLLMAHLGVFRVAIGGILMKDSMFSGLFGPKYPYSLSNDWAGLIGIYWHFLWTTYPYLAFIPIVLVTLSILSVKGILVSIQSVLNVEGGYHSSKSKKRKTKTFEATEPVNEAISFEPVSWQKGDYSG